MPKVEDRPISFKLDPDLLRELDEISKREQRTRTGTIRVALLAYVEEHRNAAAGERLRHAK